MTIIPLAESGLAIMYPVVVGGIIAVFAFGINCLRARKNKKTQ